MGLGGKSAFNNYVREKTHPAKMAAALYTVQLAKQQPEKEGTGLGSKQKVRVIFSQTSCCRETACKNVRRGV